MCAIMRDAELEDPFDYNYALSYSENVPYEICRTDLLLPLSPSNINNIMNSYKRAAS